LKNKKIDIIGENPIAYWVSLITVYYNSDMPHVYAHSFLYHYNGEHEITISKLVYIGTSSLSSFNVSTQRYPTLLSHVYKYLPLNNI